MPQGELTGERPGNYSRWHRTKDRGPFQGTPGPSRTCYQCDGDWFELRDRYGNGNLIVVAYIETIQTENVDDWTGYKVYPTKEKLGMAIHLQMRIPFFVVYHNAACTEFFVKGYSTFKGKSNMRARYNQHQYIEFIESL